jgi:hypothetical protein
MPSKVVTDEPVQVAVAIMRRISSTLTDGRYVLRGTHGPLDRQVLPRQ